VWLFEHKEGYVAQVFSAVSTEKNSSATTYKLEDWMRGKGGVIVKRRRKI